MRQINKERVQLLVNELRTTTDRQGRSTLCWINDKGIAFYCCLGIACEVAIKNGLDLPVQVREEHETIRMYGKKSHSLTLPDEVVDWYGFDADNPLVTLHSGEYSLTYCNDALQETFLEIADAIENTYIKK